MKVFLSWAGDQSRAVAELLRDWLPEVLPNVEPWLQADVIGPDNAWLRDVAGEARVIIPCVTADTLNAPWNSVASLETDPDGRPTIVPLLIGLPLTELPEILRRFSHFGSAHSEILALVRLLNQLAEASYTSELVDQRFTVNYARFERALELIVGRNVVGIASSVVGSISVTATGEVRDANGVVVDQTERLLLDIRSLVLRVLANSDEKVALKDIAPPEPAKPRLFIGSSAEGLSIAEALQESLDYRVETTIWTQDVFAPSSTTIESLVDMARGFDYAVIVMTPDDQLTKRKEDFLVPRDNLLFELGLFIGILGRGKSFILRPRGVKLELPSDLDGVTQLDFEADRGDKSLVRGLGIACTRLKRSMGVD